jgi:hypothetical protein
MENASSLSNAPTIAPADSASQVAAPKVPTNSKAGKPKRPSKSAIDKDAPPGAVQVPSGKQAPGTASKVVSATIPLSGWGTLDLYPHRKDIQPTFTTDARPYADMVDTLYQSVQSRYTAGGKHIPRTLFRYYCFTLWWYRAIWLHKSNGNVLSTEQKNFLSVVGQMEDLQVPTHVAQYLANMGNFLQGGEQYYYQLGNFKFVDGGSGTVKKGWLESSGGVKVTDADFWAYAQVPVPAVMVSALCNEADNAIGGPADLNLDLAAPAISKKDGEFHPTENIIGWSNNTLPPAHSSWRATFAQLGWSLNNVAPDVQTQYLTSTSTLKWISDRLSTLKDYKVNSIKQLTLSNQGHPMLAYFLGTENMASQSSQFPPAADVVNNTVCGSRYSELCVKSRFAIDAKVLAPAFAFGYRIERAFQFSKYTKGVPSVLPLSNYQPWLEVSGGAYVNLSPAQAAGINGTFNYGSLPFANTSRFSTHELYRSSGLDAALILTDTK